MREGGRKISKKPQAESWKQTLTGPPSGHW